MIRRDMLTTLGVGSAGVLLASRTTRADQESEDRSHLEVMGRCVAICNEASLHCLEALKSSPEQADHHARANRLMVDCQAICATTAVLMARKSPLLSYAHRACADSCRDCAEECAKGRDEIMRRCTEICRECEARCRETL